MFLFPPQRLSAERNTSDSDSVGVSAGESSRDNGEEVAQLKNNNSRSASLFNCMFFLIKKMHNKLASEGGDIDSIEMKKDFHYRKFSHGERKEKIYPSFTFRLCIPGHYKNDSPPCHNLFNKNKAKMDKPIFIASISSSLVPLKK